LLPPPFSPPPPPLIVSPAPLLPSFSFVCVNPWICAILSPLVQSTLLQAVISDFLVELSGPSNGALQPPVTFVRLLFGYEGRVATANLYLTMLKSARLVSSSLNPLLNPLFKPVLRPLLTRLSPVSSLPSSIMNQESLLRTQLAGWQLVVTDTSLSAGR